MYRFSPEVTTGSPSSQQATARQPVWCWYMLGGAARGHCWDRWLRGYRKSVSCGWGLHSPQQLQLRTGQHLYTIIHTIEHTIESIHTIHTSFQYSTVQYNTIQYNTIQYNTIQYNTQYNTNQSLIHYSTIQHTIQYKPVFNTLQYNTTHNTTTIRYIPFFNTVQYNTTHNTTHNTTIQYKQNSKNAWMRADMHVFTCIANSK